MTPASVCNTHIIHNYIFRSLSVRFSVSAVCQDDMSGLHCAHPSLSLHLTQCESETSYNSEYSPPLILLLSGLVRKMVVLENGGIGSHIFRLRNCLFRDLAIWDLQISGSVRGRWWIGGWTLPLKDLCTTLLLWVPPSQNFGTCDITSGRFDCPFLLRVWWVTSNSLFSDPCLT